MQKRLPAPFPIFNQSKKPRTALYTHPNNIMSMEQQSEQKYQSTATTQSIQQRKPLSHYNRMPIHTPAFREQQQYAPAGPSYNQMHYKEKQSCTFNTSNSMYNNQHVNSTTTRKMQHSSQQMPLIKPEMTVKSTSDRSPRSKCQMRIITASSQGLQHWSQFTSHIHLLFEVYGRVDSQVSCGEHGSKQFMLKTIDGVISVIGTWDKQKHILKCVTVRPSTPQEDKCITQAIQMCDKAMRQFTCSINEI